MWRADGPERGFTLIEMLLVVAISITISGMAIPAYIEALNRARVVRAIADIRSFDTEIRRFDIAKNRFPDDLAEAGIIGRLDPWGRPYEYLRILGGKKGKGGVRKDHKLNPINADFDLYSMGRDGDTQVQITNKDSLDDVIRANDGGFIGVARDF